MNIKKELAGYSAAAGAVLLGAAGAEGGIVYTAANLTCRTGISSLDMNDDATMDFNFDNSLASNSTSSGSNRILGLNNAEAWKFDNNNAENVGAGLAVSAGRSFKSNALFLHVTSSGVLTSGQFDTPGYIGVRFDPAGGSEWLYGWIHIDSVAGDYTSYHIDGYAYETDGGSIVAGAVPEPSSLALLALGAAGVRFLRKRYDQV